VNMRIATIIPVILLAAAGFVSNASAQQTTPQDGRLELAQASNDRTPGLAVTSTDSATAQSPSALKPLTGSGTGTDMSGSSAGGMSAPMSAIGRARSSSCVGPVSFCNLYFGS
jgi:hypothetical protein